VSTDKARSGYRQSQEWVQTRPEVGTDQARSGYRPGQKWVQTRPGVDTNYCSVQLLGIIDENETVASFTTKLNYKADLPEVGFDQSHKTSANFIIL
jgi:hypothetical protein